MPRGILHTMESDPFNKMNNSEGFLIQLITLHLRLCEDFHKAMIVKEFFLFYISSMKTPHCRFWVGSCVLFTPALRVNLHTAHCIIKLGRNHCYTTNANITFQSRLCSVLSSNFIIKQFGAHLEDGKPSGETVLAYSKHSGTTAQVIS